jgi:glycosyltransferase involved in cell wall biosynthesis
VPDLPVLLDATSIPPNRGGVARYISGLLVGLHELGLSVDVVVKGEDAEWLHEQAPSHRYRLAPPAVSRRPVRFVWEQLMLPGLVRRIGATTLHAPHYTFPVVLGARTVVTLHDATFFSDPGSHSRLKVAFFRFWTRFARQSAKATVTPSRATADELDRLAGPAKGPTAVAHLGVDLDTFRVPSEDDVRAFAVRHGLAGEPSARPRWIAFLGTIEPRKQVPALIEAHAARTAADPSTPPLLVAGGLGWDDDAKTLLDRAGDTPGAPLRYLGYLPLDELGTFLGGADVVVYPSIAEGFGLPVLEAMAAGGNVLTTRRLAIPEVGGDAVTYAEPDATSLAGALSSLQSEDPATTASRRAAAHDRAATFTWRVCADAHLGVYA